MFTYENIKTACKKSEISISALENRLGFSCSSICKWDTNTPGVDKVKAVADILGVTVNDMLAESSE